MSQAFFGVLTIDGIPAYCSGEDCERAADLVLQYHIDVEEHGAASVDSCEDWADGIAEEPTRVVEILRHVPVMSTLVDWAREKISDAHFAATV